MRQGSLTIPGALVMALLHPPSTAGQEVVVFVSDRDGDREIYSMRFDGRHQTNLSRHPGRDQAPVLSPDQTQVAWISDRSGALAVWRMAVDGSGQELIREIPEADFGLAWSPNGKELAITVQEGEGGVHDLAVLGLDDGNLRRLTDTPLEEEITPTWSPSGDDLYYIAGTGSATSLMRYRLASGRQDVVVSGLSRAGFPTMSPAGTEILVRSQTDQFDVLRIDVETGAVENLTRHTANDWGAVWSRDGTKVLFASDRDGDMEIFVLDLTSRQLEQLTENEARDWMPGS